MKPATIRVLLLEDNPADARLLIESLNGPRADSREFEVMVAQRVAEIPDAMWGAAWSAVDVALVDLTLPDSTGLETVERVRAALPDVPIVVLTGLADNSVALEAMREGAQDYLLKGELDQSSTARAIRYAMERQRANNLRIAKEHAEAESRAKDMFLAIVSHDLRTPLQAIMLWAKHLRDGRTSESAAEVGSIIVRCAQQQSRLIEDLLDASQIIHGTLQVNPVPIDLAEVVRTCEEMARPVAEAKGVELQHEGLAFPVPINGDPVRLRQVVSNLLSNAVKFTPRGGRVKVVLNDLGKHASLRVTDTGCGIDPKLLPHVFDRFWQADAAAKEKRHSLGLGLTIARHIVEQHGGTIQAASEGPGCGTTFTLELKRECVPAIAVRKAARTLMREPLLS